MYEYKTELISINEFSDFQVLKRVKDLLETSIYKQDYKNILLTVIDKEFDNIYLTNDERAAAEEDLKNIEETELHFLQRRHYRQCF